MKLPKFLQPYLASYDLDKLDGRSEGVKKEVISEVLNSGSTESVSWIFNNYSVSEIKKVLLNPIRGSWLPTSLNYWQKIFDIYKPNFSKQNALLRYS
ncbi:MAG: hypothetical protein AAB778_01845 [Patescibacteria group bacterium]